MNYYVARDGVSLGPYNETQTREYLRLGVFTEDDLVCREGEEDWRPMGALFSPTPATLSIEQPSAPIEAEPPPPPIVQSVQPTASRESFVPIFLTVFLAILLGGGVLLAGWKYFSHEQTPRPFVVPSARATPAQNSANEKKGQLQGAMFIATNGGTSYKLGAVEIGLYPRVVLEEHLQKKKEERDNETARLRPLINAAKAERERTDAEATKIHSAYLAVRYNDPSYSQWREANRQASEARDDASHKYIALLNESSQYRGGKFLFAGLPTASTITMTDADGKFAVEIPTTGQYALAATALRRISSDTTEHYYWLIGVSLDGATQKTVMLTNTNLTTAGAADSLASSSEED